MRDPGTFRHEIEALPRGSWVVVDEVQKLPSLLNEIHDALTSAPRRWRFALTGSSARRLPADSTPPVCTSSPAMLTCNAPTPT